MPVPERQFDPSPETPVEDYVDQQQPVVHDEQSDDEAVGGAVPRRRIDADVEANEADVAEQSLEVRFDDDYPDV